MEITSALEAAAKFDPLTLAIFFIGVISLGTIWLAAIVIKSGFKNGKKDD